MRWTNRNADFLPLADTDWNNGREVPACQLRFGSAHSSGLNAVHCDGSVHMVEYSVDPIVWEYRGVRNDGEVIN